jgi:hypothetical protein
VHSRILAVLESNHEAMVVAVRTSVGAHQETRFFERAPVC